MKCSAPLMIADPTFKDQSSSNPNKGVQDRTIPIRCGKCEGCLKSKINDWAFRLEQEGRFSLHVHFVTLTYDPLFVPLTNSNLQTLKKRDVQLYIKRLRKLLGHNQLKYFAVGEYGTTTHRPHYHIILFNCDDDASISKAWELNKTPLGNIHIGTDISNGAIPYTLKYMYKKGLVPAFSDDDRLPEFRLMSQKLGLKYLSKDVIKWHLTKPNERMYVRTQSGLNVAMPRYFREKLIDISGLPRTKFMPDDIPSPFISADDKDYRTVQSRVQRIKTDQNNFLNRTQQNRKKL